MDKEILAFGVLKLKKNKFYGNKTSTFLRDVDIKKVLVSNKICLGEKGYKILIGYLYEHKIKPLHIMLPKTSAYIKCYGYDGQTKWMYLRLKMMTY